MSVVSGVVLIYTCAEEVAGPSDFPLNQVNAWLAEREFAPLVAVEDATAGWHPGCRVLIGGYNHFDEEAFSTFIQGLPWAYPENSVLIIEPEEGATKVVRGGK